MYSLPSASHMREPEPRTMMGGSPPTDLNARAGESTPPGITRSARCCSARDLLRSKGKRKIYHRGQEVGGRAQEVGKSSALSLVGACTGEDARAYTVDESPLIE